MRTLRSAGALALTLALAGAAYQQAPTAPKNAVPAATPRSSRGESEQATPERVLARIHAIDDMEITAARLAAQKSRDSEVIRFARLLGRDHRLTDRKVDRLAAAQHWGVDAARPDARDRAELRELQAAAAGPEFDRAYVSAMRAGHDRALSELDAARAAATDMRLRSFLEELLPVLRQHRDLADKLLTKRLS